MTPAAEHPPEILIRDASILTLDDKGRFIERGDILIRGNTIVEVGEITEPGEQEAVRAQRRIIHARGQLAAPGLVNAHMHSQSASLAGFADTVSHPAFMWLTQAHTARMTSDDIRLSVFLSAMQMISTGTTTALDHFPGQLFSRSDMETVLSAWSETGMRALVGMRFYDDRFGDILPENADEAVHAVLRPHRLDELKELLSGILDDWQGVTADRVRICPAPSHPDRCTDEALLFAAEISERHDVPLHTHLSETRRQEQLARERYGTSSLGRLEQLGILSYRWSFAHAIWLDDDDIRRLARFHAKVVHNPESNARIGAGTMRTPDLIAAGIDIALGTDGAGANDNLVLHEAMRAAATLHRATEPDRRRWVSARDALSMATRGGARVMGRPDLGVICAGMKADIVLYDLDATPFVPLNDPVNQLVFAENGGSVSTVIVDGDIIRENGRFTGFDAETVVCEMRDMARSIRRRNADLISIASTIVEKFN